MSDLKHLKHEITLLYQQGGFTEAKLDVRTIHALIACAEALRDSPTCSPWAHDPGYNDDKSCDSARCRALSLLRKAP
jgi:hypothetical protein